MRIAINLSSEPFSRNRPFIVASWTAGVLLTLMLSGLTWLSFNTRDEASGARQAVERARAQVTKLNAEKARLETVLLRPENGEVIERSVFLNELLLRKGISWTRIFSDLEKVMPHNVRLISVRPQITPEHHVFLDMMVASQAPEPVIEMLMKLESSAQFGATQLNTMLPPSQNEPLMRYRVTVNYAQKL